MRCSSELPDTALLKRHAITRGNGDVLFGTPCANPRCTNRILVNDTFDTLRFSILLCSAECKKTVKTNTGITADYLAWLDAHNVKQASWKTLQRIFNEDTLFEEGTWMGLPIFVDECQAALDRGFSPDHISPLLVNTRGVRRHVCMWQKKQSEMPFTLIQALGRNDRSNLVNWIMEQVRVLPPILPLATVSETGPLPSLREKEEDDLPEPIGDVLRHSCSLHEELDGLLLKPEKNPMDIIRKKRRH